MLRIAVSAIVALAGLELIDFWGARAIMGVGRNFNFIGATRWSLIATGQRMSQGTRSDDFRRATAVSILAGSSLHTPGCEAIN
jgi:hypothetical protein